MLEGAARLSKDFFCQPYLLFKNERIEKGVREDPSSKGA